MNAFAESHGRGGDRTTWFQSAGPGLSTVWFCVLLSLLSPSSLWGVPYASELTNRNGTLFFRLNESADNVRLISRSGTRTNGLGALRAGLNAFVLGNQEPYQIEVTKASRGGFLTAMATNRGAISRISPDTVVVRFFNPRGVAINNNPASPFFGRIYVANASSGTVSNTAFGPARNTGDGIYALRPDFTDALGQQDVALTGGLDFDSGKDLAPYRLTVGQDDNLYICNLSDTNGSLYVVDPDISPGSGVNVLGGPTGGEFPIGFSMLHGSIAAAAVEGSLAGSNLVAWVIDEDSQTDRSSTERYMQNSLWQHNLYDTIPGVPWQPPFLIVAAPWVGFASQIMDMSRGTNGYFYVNTYRSPGNDWAGLYVHHAFGGRLWDSLSASRNLSGNGSSPDLLQATGGGAISPDGRYAAVINLDTSAITVIPLIDGIPDLANHQVIEGFGPGVAKGRDVAWDLAGNLYAISAGAQAIRAFSPGGRTVAITGSDGTFRITRPATVSVTAVTEYSHENGEPGVFSISREDNLAGNLSVFFTLSGSAGLGIDYLLHLNTVTIPAGMTNIEILVPAIDDDLSEPAETVIFSLVPSLDYELRAPATATVIVADDDPAVINIETEDAKGYERLPDDTLSFRIERLGRTDSELLISYNTSAGTAVQNVDYTILGNVSGSNQVHLSSGQTSAQLVIRPTDDRDAEGDESVVITILEQSGAYTPGPRKTAFGVILDDELPTNGTLFLDDFDADTSSNWITLFGANNGIFDAEVFWAFDYGAIGIPPAPGSASGSTSGLFMQVNKTNDTAGGSAAINLYPAGRTFSGNYALRFDLFMGLGVASTTEHALAGINHSTLLTNRITQSTDPNDTTRGGDGVFVAIAADGSNNRDWTAYTVTAANSFPVAITNRAAVSLSSVLTSPPYAIAGSPGIGRFGQKTWTEMELSQSNSVVMLKANNQIIYSFTNTSGFTSGGILLGHGDQFDSIGSGGLDGNFALFDNIRVLTLDLPFIRRIALLPDNEVQIDFTSSFGGLPAGYLLQSATTSSPFEWTDELGAVLITTAEGFRCIFASPGDSRFYRVQRRSSEQSVLSR